jgi:hypothetical protein
MTLDPLKKLRVVIAAGVVTCLSIVGILWKPDKVIELKTAVFGVIETIQIDAYRIPSLIFVVIIGSYVLLQNYIRFLPPDHSILFSWYRRWRLRLPYASGTLLFTHRIAATLLGSLIITIVLWLVSTDPIVPVTGFYASTLFLQHAFDIDVPTLQIDPSQKTTTDTPDAIDRIDEDRTPIYTLDIKNTGQKEIRSLSIEFASFDTDGYNFSSWQETFRSKTETLSLTDGEEIDDYPLYLPPELDDTDYYLIVRISPNYFYGFFSTYVIIENS